MKTFRIFGHRGVAGHYPENTRASIDAAIALKLAWIEVDIRYVDGQLIIFHDRRLERLCQQTGSIDDLTAVQLKKLRIHNEPLLTLDELLRIMPHHLGVNLEIKGANTATPLCMFLESCLATQIITQQQLLLSSFDHQQLLTCKTILPNVDRGLLLYGVPLDLTAMVDLIEPVSIHQSIDFLNHELIAQCDQLNKKLYIYTVNEIEDIKRMVALGVGGVFSDYPERVLTYLQTLD